MSALLFALALAASTPDTRVVLVLVRDGLPAAAFGPMDERECFTHAVRLNGEGACMTLKELRERLDSNPLYRGPIYHRA